MTEQRAHLVKLLAAFAAVYLIWGSTYLAIRFAIESIPPFLMAGVRFVIAGSLLYVWERHRGARAPTWTEWRTALVVGAFLLLGGNGGVVWAEQIVPSGLAALLVATEPLWIALLLWFAGGSRPSGQTVTGLLLGFGGVALLVGPSELGGGRDVAPLGALVLVLAALSWAIGSLYSRNAPQPASQRMTAAATMLAGGALLTLTGVSTGEVARLDVAAISAKSLAAVSYLIVFGSLIGFSCYLWLMRATTPERASTYAYVNPAVALVLGWAVADEPMSLRTLIAAAVIVASVVVIVSAGKTPAARRAAVRIRTGEHAVQT